MKARALVFFALALGFAPSALARESTKQNAISYEPLAITSRGMVVQYERLLLPHWSVIGGAGARFAARDDFSSWTLVLKSEARWYMTAEERISGEEGMVGPYLGFTLTAARTALEHRSSGRDLGAMWDVEESVRFGYRFVIFGFQEITPSLGFSLVHEIDESGRLASQTRPGYLDFGLSVGWLF